MQTFLFFCFVISGFIILDILFRSTRYRGPLSDHFNGRRFSNLLFGTIHPIDGRHPLVEKHPRLSFFVKKIKTTWKKRQLSATTKPEPRVSGEKIVATFVNHSTVLIQTENINIITDPVWATRASPFSFLGPRRYMDPGVLLADLPHIDIILLSHNHYDHMDIETLRYITKRDGSVVYTPLGNSAFLAFKGISNAIDMEWGERKVYSKQIAIDCVPAQHFSARALSDRGATLWGGFVIHTPHGDIYFAGDTGYGPFVSHIQKSYPDGFRFAMLPIGAFEPRAFMQTVHMGPDEAIELYRDLKVKKAIAIHFGTFDLALDGQDTPASRLDMLSADDANRDIDFKALANGGSVTV